MTLAMQFYLGYIDETNNQQDMRGGKLISLAGKDYEVCAQYDPVNVKIVQENEEDLQRIIWWINRAISYVTPYVGMCVRWVNIQNEIEQNYY